MTGCKKTQHSGLLIYSKCAINVSLINVNFALGGIVCQIIHVKVI